MRAFNCSNIQKLTPTHQQAGKVQTDSEFEELLASICQPAAQSDGFEELMAFINPHSEFF